MSEQTEYAGFEASEFAENPEPRVPCVLLLDMSGSMDTVVANAGQDTGQTVQRDGGTYRIVTGGTTRIDLLNEGLVALKETLAADSLASKRAEIAIVTFGGIVTVVQDFVTAENFQPPHLNASGGTPMGAGDHDRTRDDRPRERPPTARTASPITARGCSSSPTAARPTSGRRRPHQVKQGEAVQVFRVLHGRGRGIELRHPRPDLHAGTGEAERTELPRPLPLALAVDEGRSPSPHPATRSRCPPRRLGRHLSGSRHVEARLRQRAGHVPRAFGPALPGLSARAASSARRCCRRLLRRCGQRRAFALRLEGGGRALHGGRGLAANRPPNATADRGLGGRGPRTGARGGRHARTSFPASSPARCWRPSWETAGRRLPRSATASSSSTGTQATNSPSGRITASTRTPPGS